MKAAEDVTYHPVLQTFSDPAKETFAKQLEKQAVVSHLNRARDRQLAVESEYDILTMSDKRSTLKAKEPKKTRQPARDKAADYEAPRLRHPLDSAYPFNIVSNIPLTQHHYSAPTQRPSLPESEFRADAADVTKPRLQTVKALPRDFNILSNTYVENHEEKMQRERDINRQTAAFKYWETHDYDPLLGKYVDPAKEQAALDRKAADEKLQPVKAFNQLPPSLQKGEGYVYDITTGIVKNQELYDKSKAAEQRWLDSKKATWTREANMTQQGIIKQDLDDARAHNRASHRRYFETFGNGYNIIDHRDFQNPNTYMPPARTKPPSNVWQTISSCPVNESLAASARALPARPPQSASAAPQCLASTSTVSSKEVRAVRTGGFQRMASSAGPSGAAC